MKSRNRFKLKNKTTKEENFSGPVGVMLDNPFSDMTHKQKKAAVLELAKKEKKNVIEIFKSLNDILRQYDPMMLIAMLSCYGLILLVGDDGVQANESSGKLNQAHIELIQALALQIPENEIGKLPVHPLIVERTWGQLIEISRAFQLSRTDAELLRPAKMVTNGIQELMRGHTQIVRNPGFFHQLVTTSKEIHRNFDELIENKLGFSASNVIDIFETLVDLTSSKLNARYRTLLELHSIKKPYDMLVKYHQLIGQGQEEVDEFLEKIDINEMSRDGLFLTLQSHYDLAMPNYFLVNSDELSEQLNIEKAIIDSVLSYFSYTFGDLSDRSKESFFLDNPIWNKPIISSGREYYCLFPVIFFSFALNTLDEIVNEINKASLHKRRANYLECKIEEIVKRRFPKSHVVRGFKWTEGKDQYETDLIAFIDSYAIIIEAKSNKISKSTLRGAPGRIKSDIKEILIKPSIQSQRFERKLNELRAQKALDDPFLKKLPVNIDAIKKVLRVSVSLDNFATLQKTWRLFDDAGWLPNDFVPCPSMHLAEFETVFDFLERPIQIIHYLLKRTELEGKYYIAGDELDYMGLYITNSLSVENMVSDNKTHINILGMSKSLDKYYTSKDFGILIDKPQLEISPLFKKILAKLEERAFPGWTEIGCVLYGFPLDWQNKIRESIKYLSKEVNRSWEIEGHKNSAIWIPPGSSEYALAIVLFKNKNRAKRHEFIHYADALALKREHVKYCLVIAINIDNDYSPYDWISLSENGDAE